MLEIRGLSSGYGQAEVLHEIDLTVGRGEIVALIGANGAGKSTLVKCLAGLIPARSGSISLEGRQIESLSPRQRVEAGLCLVPEGRQTFGGLSIEANLRLGAYAQPHLGRDQLEERIAEACRAFPVLLARRHEPCANLSGGQQQMLAIARGLMSCPKVLLLDEPSLGLSPRLVTDIFRLVADLGRNNIAVLLSEQNARQSLAIAQRAYVLENGRVTAQGRSAELIASADIAQKYLGVGRAVGQSRGAAQRELSDRLKAILAT